MNVYVCAHTQRDYVRSREEIQLPKTKLNLVGMAIPKMLGTYCMRYEIQKKLFKKSIFLTVVGKF